MNAFRDLNSGPTSVVRKRVAIVAPSAYLFGGVQAWLDYLVPGLEAAGWDVSILLAHGVHSDAHRYLRAHPFPRVRLLENRTGSREGRVRAICAAIQMDAPELVLAVNIVDACEAVARMRRRFGGPRVAMALHGLHPSFYQDIAGTSTLLDGVIATNRLGAAAAVVRGGLPADRVYYAPCGVVVPDLAKPAQSIASLALVFAGRFDATEKRVLDLPHILRALHRRGVDFSMKLAGAGPAESELRNALLEFGERVEFLGVLDEAQMRELFVPGAIALVMSPSETGPLVAWEALANGAALVSSRFVGIGLEDSLRDGETCLTFPVGDTEAAANAIARLVDPDLRQSLAKAGYEMVRQRYGRDASIRAWDAALRGILNQETLSSGQSLPAAPSAGRLDRFLGAGKAEILRRLTRSRFAHVEPGGEWPHSYGTEDDESFRQLLVDLDHRHNSSRVRK